jgi:carbohydrate-selective porin OprB
MVVGFVFCGAITAQAADDAPNFSDTLTGDWHGRRTDLYNRGILLEGSYKLDLWRNLSGGSSKGTTAFDDLDLKMTVDGEKAYGLQGSTLYISLLNNMGGRINDYAATNGGTSNIEVPHATGKLYEGVGGAEFP